MNNALRPFRVYSIPHTGTRFVLSFFKYQGFMPNYDHVGGTVADIALVIPKRHPYQCYESHSIKPGFDLGRFIGWWHELIWRAKQQDSIVFPIEQRSEETEQQVCEFVGIPWHGGFPWVPVGSSGRDRSSKRYLEVAEHLQFAVDWYGDK